MKSDCKGRHKNGTKCTYSTYKCKNCGNEGCHSLDAEGCTGQGFRHAPPECKKCGKTGQQKRITDY